MSASYQRGSGLREQRMGEEVMVFDSSSDQVHVLNSTSAFVWDCLATACDTEMIEAKMREHFDVSAIEDLAALVRRALGQLADKGLVEECPDGPA